MITNKMIVNNENHMGNRDNGYKLCGVQSILRKIKNNEKLNEIETTENDRNSVNRHNLCGV